jgi:hypothetical protein
VSQAVDFFAIDSFLPGAEQIELVLTKAAGSANIGAYFNIWGLGGLAGNQLLLIHAMDTINNVTGLQIAIYDGEDYTRVQFMANDTGVPVGVAAPAPLGLLALGLGVIARFRRRE